MPHGLRWNREYVSPSLTSDGQVSSSAGWTRPPEPVEPVEPFRSKMNCAGVSEALETLVEALAE